MFHRISNFRAGIAALALIACAAGAPALAADAKTAPMVSLPWQPQLPGGMVMAEISSVAVGPDDTVWVLSRPRTVPEADRAKAAPPVTAFTRDGKYLRGFGGDGAGYEWPRVEHSLAVDAQGRVWIGGSFRRDDGKADDDMLLAFDAQGKFIRQVGRRGASTGNDDHVNLHAPADIYVDSKAHEVYVADGYGNNRLLVLDSETGAFKRQWSAFGEQPPAAATGSPANTDEARNTKNDNARPFVGVHGVEVDKDGVVYVSDRGNSRIQIFTKDGKYLRQLFVNRGAANLLSASGIAFSADPDQRMMYVADWGNSEMWVYDRKSLNQIGRIDGKFTGPHLIAVDSTGALYVAEVQGHRISRWAPKAP